MNEQRLIKDNWTQPCPDLWIRRSTSGRIGTHVYKSDDGYWYCEGSGLPYKAITGIFASADTAIQATYGKRSQ